MMPTQNYPANQVLIVVAVNMQTKKLNVFDLYVIKLDPFDCDKYYCLLAIMQVNLINVQNLFPMQKTLIYSTSAQLMLLHML